MQTLIDTLISTALALLIAAQAPGVPLAEKQEALKFGLDTLQYAAALQAPTVPVNVNTQTSAPQYVEQDTGAGSWTNPAPQQAEGDTVRPVLLEATFGKQVSMTFPEITNSGTTTIRIATSEPVNLSAMKWKLKVGGEYVEQPIAISVISENATRSSTTTCYVQCGTGYYSVFNVVTPLVVKFPYDKSRSLYEPLFSVPDTAGNYSFPWHTAADVTTFSN